jgi:DNA polymerase-3 subunit alpha
MSFVHLHVHSEYSLLDGFSNLKKLTQKAADMGMPAIALTDHGTMFGIIEFFNAAQKAQIKPILGLETYLAPRRMVNKEVKLDKQLSHLVLMAETPTGYQNLLKIASAAQLEGFYYSPRIDHEYLAEHAEGIIASSACMSGEIPRALLEAGETEALKKLDWYLDLFGKDHFFLELQSHNIPEIPALNQSLIELAAKRHARLIATNDVHYIEPEDAHLQDVMLAIQTGSVLSEQRRMRMTDETYYLRSADEMRSLFGSVPGAIENTLEIAERCNVKIEFTGYHLPIFEVPEGHTAATYLRELCERGCKIRYGDHCNDPAVRERMEYELSVIHDMGFDAYFLIVWDLCRHAREKGIWYEARGSAAGSLVGYVLHITMVEPLKHKLLFERFLNPSRISMPDVDLDFQDDRRVEMLEYCCNKYGDDKVAQIITFGTLAARGAMRDVGRVLDIDRGEIDQITKLIPNTPGKPVTISEVLETVPEFKAAYDEKDYIRELIDTASKVEGVVRNAGTHAAGVVISDKPIVEYLPLHRPTSGSEDSPIKTVTQFEMSILDSLGMLKVDFLGLAYLTIMQRACDMIEKRHGVKLTLENIPLDDPPVFEMLGKGQTAGVFQLEGTGMTRFLVQMKPENLSNVIAMVALFRPGPMQFIPQYINRLHGEPVTYRHPLLEPIFKETYGIGIYQEQIMQAAVDIAGYTLAEADDLRKAISKKQAAKIQLHKEKFVIGASKKDLDEQTATSIFEDWEEFARYGFNKSHAADYGVMAVETAYLKVHYPVEYLTALLSVNMSDSAKVSLYVTEARNMGIEVLPPDIRFSEWNFSIEDRPEGTAAIRFGLGAIKNVGNAPVEQIVQSRQEGPFKDLYDLANRVDLRQVGRRSLECLVKVGALDGFGNRCALLEGLDSIIAVSSSNLRARNSGQLSIFEDLGTFSGSIKLPDCPEMDRRTVLGWERELIGMYISAHPLAVYQNELKKKVTHFSSQLVDVEDGEKLTVAGMVTQFRPYQTKTGNMMGFVTIEDFQGTMELVLFPRTWEKYSRFILPDQVILVDGKLGRRNNDPSITADHIAPIKLDSMQQDVQEKPDGGAFASQVAFLDEYIGLSDPDTIPEEKPQTPFDEMPPMPEWDEWTDELEQPSIPKAPEKKPEDRSNPSSANQSNLVNEVKTQETPVEKPSSTAASDAAVPIPPVDEEMSKPSSESWEALTRVRKAFNYLVSPINGENPPQVIVVSLFATGDRMRDQRRMEHLFGVLRSSPGKDRFVIQVKEGKNDYQIDFPNQTIGICDDLLGRLRTLVGQENIWVRHVDTSL